ncbi:hypothetical protein E1281_19760 [Actinomadura sp. KC345]|uniref:EamA family transporter n=1 Tax=Actinomadura sp. KC345 TaxID=2530371 RepID=UPI001048667B|nr:EamA family transporter [Actinomadura sp. KC345]TDC51948.1 hypothetical protein E1281_19760 [Actinomadura sp. KC345]
MTNETSKTTGRHPWYGVLLGGFDRLSSAGGKAVLDERLIGGSGPLPVQHATFLEATIGGLLLLIRLYLPALPFLRNRRGSGTPDDIGEGTTRRRVLVFLTFLTIAGDKALLVLALTAVPFSIAGGIYYAIPLLVPVIWGFRSGKKGLAAFVTLFAAATAFGVVLIVQDGTAQGGYHLVGVLLAIGAGVSRTLFLPVTDRLIKGAGRRYTEKAIAWSLVFVGLVAGGIAAVTGDFESILDWEIIAWAALVGLLNNTLPRIFQMPARELAGDRVYAVFLAGSPAIATLVGVVFLGDRLAMGQVGGFVLITACAATLAYVSLALGGQAPSVELQPATPEARLEDFRHKLATAKETARELAAKIKDLELQAAKAELEVAESDWTEAQRRKTQAEAKAKAAETNLSSATANAFKAESRVEKAREKLRLTLGGESTETS